MWQQYIQQVESLSPENRVSKFFKEAGFMRVVEFGQYFVTKDTPGREYTLPRDDKASQPKGWIRRNMRIGPVLEVTDSFQHFKYGIEIRIESVNQDNSQSWVRISHGTILADPQEEQTPLMLWLLSFSSKPYYIELSVFGGFLFAPPVGDGTLRWLLPNFVTVIFTPNSF